jgi:ketosteroid isomerase-like protein
MTTTARTTAQATGGGASSPEALESLFARFVSASDLEGVVGLYAADAVVSLPRGREAAGRVAIRAAYAAALAAGVVTADPGAAAGSRAVVTGDLAMTSSTSAEGIVRTQVARRTAEGRWVWVRDGSRLRDVEACLPTGSGALAVA